jgi:hypothetical protein
LADYADQTGIDLSNNPFADKVQHYNSPDAILELLHDREKAFKEYRDGNRKLIKWLTPAVQVLHAFSGIIGESVGLVRNTPLFNCISSLLLFQVPFPPAGAIFVGLDALLSVCRVFPFQLYLSDMPFLQAASAVSSSYDALLDLFECIANFLQRLSIYTDIPFTPEMTNIIVKIMIELLSVLALATKQIKQGRFSEPVLFYMNSNDSVCCREICKVIERERNRVGSRKVGQIDPGRGEDGRRTDTWCCPWTCK